MCAAQAMIRCLRPSHTFAFPAVVLQIPKLMEELGYITGATLSKGWGDDYNTIFGPGK